LVQVVEVAAAVQVLVEAAEMVATEDAPVVAAEVVVQA
jgi:hypothetical protein